MKIWSCKIGPAADSTLPKGSDSPMRLAVQRAYEELTGQPAKFTFSGWDAELEEIELAVVEDRLPREQEPPDRPSDVEVAAAALWNWLHEPIEPQWDSPDADPDEKDATRQGVALVLTALNLPRRERELRQEIACLKACLRAVRERADADGWQAARHDGEVPL